MKNLHIIPDVINILCNIVAAETNFSQHFLLKTVTIKLFVHRMLCSTHCTIGQSFAWQQRYRYGIIPDPL